MKRFDLLVAVYIFCIAFSEFMGAKTFPLLTWPIKLNASVAIFTIPLIFTINDVIIEVFGKERARSVVRSGLVVIALILIFSLLATHLPPSMRFSSSEEAYDHVFGKSIRIAAASLVAFMVAEFMDVFIFSKIRERLGKKRLWLRNNLSNFISQGFDTVLFMTLAFYSFSQGIGGNMSFHLSLIIPYWSLKCVLSIIETPLVYIGVKWLKTESAK